MENPRQQIEARAADFLQRRDSGEWSEADQAQLEAWLEASTGHRVAFLRTEAAWEELGRLKAIGAGLPRRKAPTPEELSATHLFEARSSAASSPASVSVESERPARAARLILIAASVLLTAGIALRSYQLWFAGERYVTPVGGVATVPLQDGSHITLNTGSKVRVVFTDKERHIDLSQGEVFFEVAHDKNRPFVVQAGEKRVVAVGTQFAVRRDRDDIQVIVTEGTVRLESAGSPPRVEAAGSGATASAGTIARVGSSGVSIAKEPPAAAEEMLSWRSGYVVFHATPLAEAIAEFNRYNTRQIAIQDATMATMPLTGKFRTTNNEAFVNLLEQTYHIHARRTADEIVLTDAGQP